MTRSNLMTMTATILLLTLAACSPFKDPDKATHEGEMSRDGGYLENSKASVNIPQGALSGEVEVEVEEEAEPPAGDTVGPVYNFLPAGLTFAKPVTITIEFDPADLPGTITAGDLNLGMWTGEAWVPVPGASVNQELKLVTGEVNSFATFAAVIQCRQPEDLCQVATYQEGAGCQVSAKICDDGDPLTIGVCEPTTGACEFSPDPTCSYQACEADADCTDGRVCYHGTCDDHKECTTDADCEGNLFCDFGHCFPPTGCESDADCQLNSPYQLNYCVPWLHGCMGFLISPCDDDWCQQDSDCDEGFFCIQGKCLDTPHCDVDADCGERERCALRMCAPDSGCNSDEDCKFGGTCDLSTGVCSGGTNERCTTDTDCDDGKDCTWDHCDPYYGTCISLSYDPSCE